MRAFSAALSRLRPTAVLPIPRRCRGRLNLSRDRHSSIFIAALLALASPGCDRPSEGPPTYPVQGVLKVDGKPAEGAQVILHPAGGKDFDQRGARPTGRVEADGTFRMTTYQIGDGAPAGRYVVTVYWAEYAESLEPSPDRLKGRYGDPAKSTLNVEIQESPTTLPPWDLKSR